MAKLILVTGLVLTYFYVCELFTSWYSGDHFEKASLFWRLTGTYWWALCIMYFCNCVAPLILFWKKARTNPVILYVVSILVLIGMWFERFNIIVPSLAHDFYPYTWGIYVPTLTDSTIIVGSFAWFFLLFLGFIKLMPSLSIVEVKETIAGADEGHRACRPPLRPSSASSPTSTPRCGPSRSSRRRAITTSTVYTPVPVHEIEDVVERDRPVSRVRALHAPGRPRRGWPPPGSSRPGRR